MLAIVEWCKAPEHGSARLARAASMVLKRADGLPCPKSRSGRPRASGEHRRRRRVWPVVLSDKRESEPHQPSLHVPDTRRQSLSFLGVPSRCSTSENRVIQTGVLARHLLLQRSPSFSYVSAFVTAFRSSPSAVLGKRREAARPVVPGVLHERLILTST